MEIYVYIDALNLTQGPLLMGVLNSENVRGKEVFSSHADDGWLSNNGNKQYLVRPEKMFFEQVTCEGRTFTRSSEIDKE